MRSSSPTSSTSGSRSSTAKAGRAAAFKLPFAPDRVLALTAGPAPGHGQPDRPDGGREAPAHLRPGRPRPSGQGLEARTSSDPVFDAFRNMILVCRGEARGLLSSCSGAASGPSLHFSGSGVLLGTVAVDERHAFKTVDLHFAGRRTAPSRLLLGRGPGPGAASISRRPSSCPAGTSGRDGRCPSSTGRAGCRRPSSCPARSTASSSADGAFVRRRRRERPEDLRGRPMSPGCSLFAVGRAPGRRARRGAVRRSGRGPHLRRVWPRRRPAARARCSSSSSRSSAPSATTTSSRRDTSSTRAAGPSPSSAYPSALRDDLRGLSRKARLDVARRPGPAPGPLPQVPRRRRSLQGPAPGDGGGLPGRSLSRTRGSPGGVRSDA
ncbi:MAG: hypothetical protein MZV64_11895 [Ignavibacteriales bacterium]|nr:hypothetical protein [Ignavibacteriales bacterium]